MAAVPLYFNAIDVGGGPASGALLNVYTRGTSTRRPMWSDVGLTTPLTNPIVADADGRLDGIYFDSTVQYSILCTTADGATTILEADIVGGALFVSTSPVTLVIDASWLPMLSADQKESGPIPFGRLGDIQDLIDYCAPLEKTGFIPSGDYTTSGLLHDTGSLKLLGEDAGTQGTRFVTTSNATVLTIEAQATIDGIGFTGSSDVTKTNQVGAYLDDVNNVQFRNNIFSGLYSAVVLNETVFYTSFEGVKFFDSTGPMFVTQGASAAGCAFQFRGVEVIPSAIGGSVFDFSNLGSINSVGTISSPANATDYTLYIRNTATNAGVQQFSNDVFEGSVKSAIRIDGTAIKSVNYVFFSNCYANQSGTGEPTLLLKYVNVLHYVGGYISGTGAGIKFDGGTCVDIDIGPVRFELNSATAAILAASGSVVRNLRLHGVTLDGGAQRFMDLSAATTAEDIYIGPDCKFGNHASPVLMPAGQYANLNWRHGNKFAAHKNGTDQTGIANATSTKLTFGTELYDVRSRFASSTFSPYTGFQRMICHVYATGVTAGGACELQLYKNGALYRRGPSVTGSASNDVMLEGNWEFLSEPGDVFEIYLRGVTASTITVSGATDLTYLTGSQV